MTDEVLATVRATQPRRWVGVGVLLLLGGLLIYLGLAMPPATLLWQGFLLGLGLAALWLAERTRRATLRVIELTAQGLRDSSGEEIASLSEIAGIDRGTFALKPSNGFMIKLKSSRARRWQPGLWWALGRRVGIGGVTPGSQTKVMAQMIEALLAERDQVDSQTI